MNFYPELCRNESEVESKLIVSYLLPKLGYTPETWHQEVTFGNIRLDFLSFATQVIPLRLDSNSPLTLVMEAKHPNQNLNRHLRRLKRYLTSMNVRYGLLTNAKEIRIYERVAKDVRLVFDCSGNEIDAKIEEIKELIGRDSLKEKSNNFNALSVVSAEIEPTKESITTKSESNEYPENVTTTEKKREKTMKTIAVYHNKGGVGKTTTVVNLAAALSKQGKQVLVIDLDSQANATFALGLAKFLDEQEDDLKDKNIYHILRDSETSIAQVLRKSEFNDPEVDVIPCHISLMEYEEKLSRVDAAKIRIWKKLQVEKERYDFVIIDTPPSLNLYARIAMISTDYLIIPSDLKAFANEGLVNVKNFIADINEFRDQMGLLPVNILGVLPCKVPTNSRYVQYTLPSRKKIIQERYNLPLMDSCIFQREDLAKCVDKTVVKNDLEIPAPMSVLDYKRDSASAEEFENLATEIIKKVG